MPLSFTFKADKSFEQVQQAIATLPSWMPAILRSHMPPLGDRIAEVMRTQVEPHRYTGALSDSIESEYQDSDYSVSIHPTATRGNYDAGAILELGTKPIRRAPWEPIKAWAEFRGVPAFPVWYAIRTRGVRAHPFLDRTLAESAGPMTETARRIVTDVAIAITSGTGTNSIPSG